MSKKIVFLVVMCFLNTKVATAQSSNSTSPVSCLPIATEPSNNFLSENSDLAKKLYLNDNNSFNKAQLLQEQYNNSNSQVSVNTFQNSTTKNNSNTTYKNKIAVARVSVPSLWWAKEQFDPFSGKLIDSWLTYPQIRQIDLTVNWQLWTLLDYLGRYRFINQLGTVVREHGYNLRVFNQQQRCLALYKYNEFANPPKWEIQIEGIGQDSLQIIPIEE